MMAAEQYFTDAFVVSYGDIVYRPAVLPRPQVVRAAPRP